MVYGVEWMTRSGGPPKRSAKFHTSSSANTAGGGRSAGLPCGAPASTHSTMVSISALVSDRSFWNSWMPTDLSMCHGGICRVSTRFLMERAHGRESA